MDTHIVPSQVQEILNRKPMKMSLISREYIDNTPLKYVTSPNIFEPNSTRFHPHGLFSEEIFGAITSMERFVTEALIDLHTEVIHPMIFSTVISKKALYMSILSGKQYGVYDENEFTFKLADVKTEGAGTGYSYFLRHLNHLSESPEPTALRAQNVHKLLSKYKDTLTINKLIVLPAGLRDIDMKSSRLSKDDINKIYMNIINLTSSLSDYGMSDDPIFDGIRYQLQLKITEIYDYIMSMLSGKGGFIQKHYGARKIAYSTRNVITASTNDADTYDDPQVIKADETMISMLNLIKCFQPFFTNYVMRKLYGEIFIHGSNENVAVTNPSTLEMEYVTLKPAERNKYTTVEGVNGLINQFKYVGFRESPVSITDERRKEFWLLLVYIDETTNKVLIGKSYSDLKRIGEIEAVKVGREGVRGLTWIEAMYIASVGIVEGKYVFITRYPAIGDGSIYPSKVHPITTTDSFIAELVFDSGAKMIVPHYPRLGHSYYESLIPHASRLPGLGGDMDGDCCSCSGVWTEEGNDDIRKYMDDVSSVIGTDMKLKIRAWGDIVDLCLHNISLQNIYTNP